MDDVREFVDGPVPADLPGIGVGMGERPDGAGYDGVIAVPGRDPMRLDPPTMRAHALAVAEACARAERDAAAARQLARVLAENRAEHYEGVPADAMAIVFVAVLRESRGPIEWPTPLHWVPRIAGASPGVAQGILVIEWHDPDGPDGCVEVGINDPEGARHHVAWCLQAAADTALAAMMRETLTSDVGLADDVAREMVADAVTSTDVGPYPRPDVGPDGSGVL